MASGIIILIWFNYSMRMKEDKQRAVQQKKNAEMN